LRQEIVMKPRRDTPPDVRPHLPGPVDPDVPDPPGPDEPPEPGPPERPLDPPAPIRKAGANLVGTHTRLHGKPAKQQA
jgi:hypothetical protein